MLFNVRIYGIVKNKEGDILVSDEYIQGNLYTKFCGGGLEFGEGTRQCLQREFREELGIAVTVGDHIYTTDFFVESKFAENQQVISVYYNVILQEPLNIVTNNSAPNKENFHENNENGNEKFRFVESSFFSKDCVTLPIDKVVAEMISEK